MSKGSYIRSVPTQRLTFNFFVRKKQRIRLRAVMEVKYFQHVNRSSPRLSAHRWDIFLPESVSSWLVSQSAALPVSSHGATKIMTSIPATAFQKENAGTAQWAIPRFTCIFVSLQMPAWHCQQHRSTHGWRNADVISVRQLTGGCGGVLSCFDG